MSLSIGDQVIWSSQSNSRWTTKTGTVVCVVPPDQSPSLAMRKAEQHEYDWRSMATHGAPRSHESYVVAVTQPKRRPRLYWPKVSLLRKAAAVCT